MHSKKANKNIQDYTKDLSYGPLFISKQQCLFNTRLLQLTQDLKEGRLKSSKLNPNFTVHPIADLFSQELGMNIPALREVWRKLENICREKKKTNYQGDLFKKQLVPSLNIILAELTELSKKISTGLYELRIEAMKEDEAFLAGINLSTEDKELFENLGLTPNQHKLEVLSKEMGLRKSREKVTLQKEEIAQLASIKEKMKALDDKPLSPHQDSSQHHP